jgi:uncharacterized protein YceH (UPF0502 family)
VTDPLSAAEARVLGCLLEKQLATPQYYPLTLNSLTLACNQSSNRDPVTAYDEADVSDAVSGLREKGLVRSVLASGNRGAKYRHVLDETWALDAQHRAVLAVLLLRGPQTVGELRLRTERMASFDRLAEVEEVLGLLTAREQPLGRMLDRQPGQKETRFAHLLCGEPEPGWPASDRPGPRPPAPADVVAGLAEQVALLRGQVAELRADLDRLRDLLD